MRASIRGGLCGDAAAIWGRRREGREERRSGLEEWLTNALGMPRLAASDALLQFLGAIPAAGSADGAEMAAVQSSDDAAVAGSDASVPPHPMRIRSSAADGEERIVVIGADGKKKVKKKVKKDAPAAAAPSVEPAAEEVGEEFTAVFEVLLKSVLRTGAALDSPKAGILKKGESVVCYARVDLPTATRIRIGKPGERGWVSLFASDGRQILRPSDPTAEEEVADVLGAQLEAEVAAQQRTAKLQAKEESSFFSVKDEDEDDDDEDDDEAETAPQPAAASPGSAAGDLFSGGGEEEEAEEEDGEDMFSGEARGQAEADLFDGGAEESGGGQTAGGAGLFDDLETNEDDLFGGGSAPAAKEEAGSEDDEPGFGMDDSLIDTDDVQRVYGATSDGSPTAAAPKPQATASSSSIFTEEDDDDGGDDLFASGSGGRAPSPEAIEAKKVLFDKSPTQGAAASAGLWAEDDDGDDDDGDGLFVAAMASKVAAAEPTAVAAAVGDGGGLFGDDGSGSDDSELFE
eukprot:COSAG04_NODE_1903_length_5262_cov_2.214604_3_plen_516_part_00